MISFLYGKSLTNSFTFWAVDLTLSVIIHDELGWNPLQTGVAIRFIVPFGFGNWIWANKKLYLLLSCTNYGESFKFLVNFNEKLLKFINLSNFNRLLKNSIGIILAMRESKWITNMNIFIFRCIWENKDRTVFGPIMPELRYCFLA